MISEVPEKAYIQALNRTPLGQFKIYSVLDSEVSSFQELLSAQINALFMKVFLFLGSSLEGN